MGYGLYIGMGDPIFINEVDGETQLMGKTLSDDRTHKI